MKIHGLVYIVVGAFLIVFSYYISSINENIDVQKFMLFIWFGVVFVVVGLVKMIATALSQPKIAKENFPHHQAKSRQNVQSGNVQHQGSLVKFCSKCGSAVRHFDNFCYKCGNRMFHRK